MFSIKKVIISNTNPTYSHYVEKLSKCHIFKVRKVIKKQFVQFKQ